MSYPYTITRHGYSGYPYDKEKTTITGYPVNTVNVNTTNGVNPKY